jgi:hypothetical protein
MSPENEPERPAPVALIGRVWLVLAVLLSLRSAFNLVVWTALRSSAPNLPEAFGLRPPARVSFFRPLVEHFAAIQMVEAIA